MRWFHDLKGNIPSQNKNLHRLKKEFRCIHVCSDHGNNSDQNHKAGVMLENHSTLEGRVRVKPHFSYGK